MAGTAGAASAAMLFAKSESKSIAAEAAPAKSLLPLARKRLVQPVVHQAVAALGDGFVIAATGRVLAHFGEAMHRVADHHELPVGRALAHFIHEGVGGRHG